VGAVAINESRCWGWLMQLAELTDPEQPWTRRAFSERHTQGRQWLAGRMRELGLLTSIDAAGNLIGRVPGSEPLPRTIMIGSHSDTVTGGGRFDGIAGVIAGLEVAAALQDGAARLRHTLEVVDFLAEEPNEFGLSCIGSRGMAGALDDDMLKRTNPAGISLREGLTAVGASPAQHKAAIRADIAAFFELHIEQGPVLEQERRDVGIVTHIVGIRRLAVTFAGQAAHAGTTPLGLRQDALLAAARFVIDLRQQLEEVRDSQPFVIATVGEIHVAPNAPNVVPGEAKLIVDLRSDNAAALGAWTDRIRALAQNAAATNKVRLSESRVLSASEPATCAPALATHLRAAARELGLEQRDIVSGAGHDAAFLARVAPAAMIFVPSRDGLSHCAQEWTEPAALGKGVAALLSAVRRFDAQSDPAAGEA